MEKAKFYADLAELLEVDEIDPALALDQYDNWDSLTALALIAILDKEFGVSMTAKGLGQFETAADLYAELDKLKA